ncbi:MAG: hypothetical protein KIS92_04460 [Planctomycetota bacterium]|nr:hypothetical protein [Planctomycetota bacterium]
MPGYSGTYATPRLDLGRAMWEYMLGSQQFIGTRVLPIFRTMKKSAAFSKITRESILRSRNVKRAPRGSYSRDQYEAKDQSYSCEERGHEQPLDDVERELYASDFSAELAAARIAANVVLLEQERDIASMIFNATTWNGAALYTDNSGAPWATVGTDIIGQVDAAKDKVRTNSGMKANALIISQAQIKNLKANTAIKAAISYVAIPTEDQILAALTGLFGLKHVIVGDQIRNSAKEGQAFVGADVWSSSYAMIARVAESEDLTEPCIGRTMLWTADSPENATVEEYREEQTRSWVYRARHQADEVVFDANYGHLLKIA